MGAEFMDRFVGAFRTFQQAVRAAGMYKDAVSAAGDSAGPEVMVEGLGKVLSFHSLGYLGITDCPELKRAMTYNVDRYSPGSMSSRTVMDYDPLRILEQELANFKQAESCLLLNTGYAAGAYLTELVVGDFMAGYDRMPGKPRSLVFMDDRTHISIQEELMVVRRRDKVRFRKYGHLDYGMLEEQLEQAKDEDGVRFIFTDSIFSMNGSIVDARELLRIAKKYEAFVVMDNAHSDGCYGDRGCGILDAQGIKDPEDLKYFQFQTGTMSKAFGLLGGYVTLPYCMSDLARVSCKKYVFSVAASPLYAANASAALRLVRGFEGDSRRGKLHRIAKIARRSLQENGFNTLNSDSHIVPAVIGEEQKCLAAQDYILDKHRIFIGAIRFPAVEANGALLRTSLTALHTDEHVERLLLALRDARDKFKF